MKLRTAVVFSLLPIVSWYSQAQNPKAPIYPGGTVGDKDTGIQVNRFQTTLLADITSASTTVSLTSTAGLLKYTYLGIDSEYMMVCNVVDSTTVQIGKSSCPNADGRGLDGSTAAPHASNGGITTVAAYLVAGSFNQLAAEVKPIEGPPGFNPRAHASTHAAGGPDPVTLTESQTTGLVSDLAGKQPTTFLQAGTGAVSRTLTGKVQEVISVRDFGAKGDGATDDTTAIAAAIAAACALPYAPRVVFPSPPGTYIVKSTLQLCGRIDVFGYGHPIINYSGAGALFKLTGTLYYPNIHGLTLYGSRTSGQIGVLIQGVIATEVHFYDMGIYQFGDVATHTGAGIEVLDSDSASMSITQVELANDGDNILTRNTATDGLNVAEDHFGGTGYCVRIEGGNGAGAARITHNVFVCAKGAIKYNPTYGVAIIDHNEFEAVGPVTDPNNAVYEFLAGVTYVANNLSNSHAYAAYDFYVGNGVSNSTFWGNQGGASTGAVFYVGAGGNNTYWDNKSFIGGPMYSALYSNTNYPGIIIAPASGTPTSATFWRGDGAWATAATSSTPAGNAACTAGQLWFDASFIYVCTASGSVKRAALTSF